MDRADRSPAVYSSQSLCSLAVTEVVEGQVVEEFVEGQVGSFTTVIHSMMPTFDAVIGPYCLSEYTLVWWREDASLYPCSTYVGTELDNG